MALSEPTESLAKFLAELILDRHLKSSTIFTSNKTFRNWAGAFGDQYTTAMVIDRVFENSEVIEIIGESYRVKDRVAHK